MPRGQRKRGQFAVKFWMLTGSSWSETTTRDLTPDEFVESLTRLITRLQKLAESAKEPPAEHPTLASA